MIDFLTAAGWAYARRVPLAGDASARRYERLTRGDDRAVLMISPSACEIERFALVGNWLCENGFSAPRIYAQDPDQGLMLIEDLGDDLLSSLLEAAPDREGTLYGHVTDFLIDLHRLPPPAFVEPLDVAGLIGLTLEHAPLLSRDTAAEVPGLIADLFQNANDMRPVLSLRDFHAQNMLWLPERQGSARLGLLDFQDAVSAHPAYDLVSALQDVRRAVSPGVEILERARYAAARRTDPDRFDLAYALIGAQRALRIHGVFIRLCRDLNKPQYISLLPRNWDYLMRNLTHPGLAPLARAVTAGFAPPTDELLSELRQPCATPPTP